jgi:hypothetical protein
MVDHRANDVLQTAVHLTIDLFLGLTETVALISNRFNVVSPDKARSQPLGPVGGVCSSLLLSAVEINPKV